MVISMKIVAFIPIKLNNERIPGKKIKLFSEGTPLMHCMQKALLQSDLVDETYVYCSKEEVYPYLLEMDEIESTDINNTIDFEIAAALYMNYVKKSGGYNKGLRKLRGIVLAYVPKKGVAA